MRYVDKDGITIDPAEVDLSKGYLIDYKTVHHAAVPESGHMTYKRLPGGGREQIYVIDQPYVPAYDEVVCQQYLLYADVPGPDPEDKTARINSLEARYGALAKRLADLEDRVKKLEGNA